MNRSALLLVGRKHSRLSTQSLLAAAVVKLYVSTFDMADHKRTLAALAVAITIRFETGYKIHDKSERRQGDASDGAASLHRVLSIGEDRDGNIWFGQVEQGPWRYDGESLRNFTAEDGLTSSGVMAIYTDRQGDLWLGGEGVYKFNGKSFDRIH